MKKILLICLACIYLIACKESLNSPADGNLMKKSFTSANTDNHKITMGITSSENPLSFDNVLKNKVNIRVNGKITLDDENSSLMITSDHPNNHFLPRDIKFNSKEVSYKINGKKETKSFKKKQLAIRKAIKESRERTEKWKDKEKIDWLSMNNEERIAKFNELGYDVASLGNDRYEISRDMDALGNGNSMHIKTIINIKNQMPESSNMYKDGKLVSQHLDKTIDGKKVTYSKMYGKKDFRQENNFIIIKEYE